MHQRILLCVHPVSSRRKTRHSMQVIHLLLLFSLRLPSPRLVYPQHSETILVDFLSFLPLVLGCPSLACLPAGEGALARNAQPTPTPRHPPFSLSLHQSRVVPAPLLPSARSVTVQAQATGRGTRQRDMTALSPCDHIAALPTHPLPLRVQRNFWGAGLVLALGPEDEARCLRWKDFRRGRGLQQLSKTAW